MGFSYVCKYRNQSLLSWKISDIHNLGHRYESYQNFLKLVSDYPMGTLSLPTKFQLSSCSHLGVMERLLSEINLTIVKLKSAITLS